MYSYTWIPTVHKFKENTHKYKV